MAARPGPAQTLALPCPLAAGAAADARARHRPPRRCAAPSSRSRAARRSSRPRTGAWRSGAAHTAHGAFALARSRSCTPFAHAPPAACRRRGFTKFNAGDYEQWKADGRILPDGVNAKLLTNHGRLDERKPEHLFLSAATNLREAVHEKE